MTKTQVPPPNGYNRTSTICITKSYSTLLYLRYEVHITPCCAVVLCIDKLDIMLFSSCTGVFLSSRSRHITCHFFDICNTATHQDEEKLKVQQLYQCQGCNKTFISRDQLFKHLRGEDEASINCPLSVSSADEEEILLAAAIRYGYHYNGDIKDDEPNEVIANRIYQAFEHQIDIFLDDKENDESFTTSALTYSTAAKMRQPSLGQDKGVKCAVAEVLSFNYRLSNTPMVISKWKEFASSGILQTNMQAWLDEHRDDQVQIQLHNMDLLVPRSSKFYAERSATQICYRYVFPISWILPNDKDNRDEEMARAMDWWKYISNRSSINHRTHEPRGKNSPLCPIFIKKLKQSLKQLESKTVANRKLRRQSQREISDDDNEDTNNVMSIDIESESTGTTRLSPGRFGQLWRKEKRCWSNFADGKGLSVSPGFEAVWRTIDRAKIVGFIQNEKKNDSLDDIIQNMHIVIEFRADGFVIGQIPRLITSLVASTNEWYHKDSLILQLGQMSICQSLLYLPIWIKECTFTRLVITSMN